MRPHERREKLPTEVDWASREGEELGYQKMYGEYGSNARGWVDRPHAGNWARRDDYSGSYETYPDYSGIAPRSYQRSDESLLEAISEALTWSPDVDATDITIAVKNGDVILSGTVPDRTMIYIVDELLEEIYGIKNIDNHIKRWRNV